MSLGNVAERVLRAEQVIGKHCFFCYDIVLNGKLKDEGMASFGSVLRRSDAVAIRAYLIKRANEDR